jgi:uncharacterized lipoprotein YajG
MKKLTLIALALLAGCVQPPKLVSTSPRSVTVWSAPTTLQAAQNTADAECKKGGRYARMASKPSDEAGNIVFDCIE